MNRYRLLAFYEDKTTEARVAQVMVVIAVDDRAAIQAAKARAAKNALFGRVPSIQVVEKRAVVPEVVFCGDPYIPINWPGFQPLATESAASLAGRH